MLVQTQQTQGTSRELAVLDRKHLARYTLGDERLEHEVLGLFIGQLPRLLKDLESASSDLQWKMASHTIKGSARAIGAWRLAASAEGAESCSVDCRADIKADVAKAAQDVLRSVEKILTP